MVLMFRRVNSSLLSLYVVLFSLYNSQYADHLLFFSALINMLVFQLVNSSFYHYIFYFITFSLYIYNILSDHSLFFLLINDTGVPAGLLFSLSLHSLLRAFIMIASKSQSLLSVLK